MGLDGYCCKIAAVGLYIVANENYDVFVSYSRADWRHAVEIDSVLRAKGLRPFFDRRNLAPGLPWFRALEQAINAARAVIVLVGPRGLGNTQQYERDLALVRQAHDPAFPVVPVMLPETTTDLPFDFLRVLTWVDFSHVAKVSDAPDVLEHLLAAIHGREAPAEAREAICPYRGLDVFREEDAAFFFGRGSADDPKSPVGELVCKVREHPFVMLVGRSGSGKSSLIYAGLVPALRRERDRFWNVLSLRPGSEPLRALAAAFNPRADNEGAADYAMKITNEADKLRTGDPELLSHMIGEELDQAECRPDRLLLYIDQWEELYAQAPSSSDRERAGRHAADVNRFIDLLLNATRTAPVTFIATVRADFYDPLIGHQEIRSLLPTRQILLGSMPRSELERTIVEPAKKVGLAFDPSDLVQRILDEAGEDEGMLPLLQYALKESWALRKGNTITGDSYARSGGVREAIRITAERTFEALSAEDQRAARRLFLRLVTPGEGQEDTRARAAMPSEPTQRRIVEQFAGPRTRLLVTGWDRAARPIVEVAHEALIRTWPRLRGWIDANRDKLRARAAVLQAKAEWEQQGRREDLLLSAGFQLERARALLADSGDITIDDIKEFIAFSSAREEAERKEREAALAREEARVAELKAGQARTARLQRITRWAVAAVAAVILIAGGVVAYLQADKAKQLATQELALAHAQANILAELSGTRLLRGEFDSALRLAAHGVHLDLASGQQASKGSRAAAALAAAVSQAGWRLMLSGHDNLVASAAFSPDGSRIATASLDTTARIWDAATGLELMVLRGHDNFVASAAFSPDGSRIVTASRDKTARVWDAETGAVIVVLHGHEADLVGAYFNHDGKQILTSSLDGTVRIWDTAQGKEIAVLRGHEAAVRSAAFSPDGSRIVTASDDATARVWDAATGKEIAVLRGHTDSVRFTAFSPDGSRIVTASGDRTARIWDAATDAEIAVLRGHEDQVIAAAFSPSGTQIVTASADQTARIWDAATAKEVAVLRGHQNVVASAGFSPDGLRIVTASFDARIWDAATGLELMVLRGHHNLVASAAFSPDGLRIVTASLDNSVRVWDSTGNEVAVLRGHEDQIDSATFSFDGSRIVTASYDMTARIWDAATAKEVAVLRGPEAEVLAAAFSPDGSRIVTASGDQTARIWDAATAAEIAVLRGHEDQVIAAAFSPSGTQIVTASADQTARIWNAATAKEVAVLRGHQDQVQSAAFSPDGSRIVTAAYDNTAIVWDATTGKEIVVLRGHEGEAYSAAFSPSGTQIVTASLDQTARIWDAATGNEIAVLRGHEAAVRSAAFNPDGSRIVTASDDATARVWDAATGKEIAVLRGHTDSVRFTAFSPDGSRVVTASQDRTARVWDVRFLAMSAENLLVETCTRRLGRLSNLTREEMRLAGYPDSAPEIDVCAD
jgi:WD40 repeat protein/energy-coupling factor transporter ATP-binding protein EcfA2